MIIKPETVLSSRLLSNISNLPKRHLNCGFKNYKKDTDNERQLEVCKNWGGKESITLTGKPGTGKTHLAIAMMKNIQMIELPEETANNKKNNLEWDIQNKSIRYTRTHEQLDAEYYQKVLDSGLWKYRRADCLFVSFVEMFVEINTAAMNDNGKQLILERYATDKNYDCICFDDLGAEKLTDAKRENLYYIIDSRYREMLPTIITSNFTINEINDVEPRIASRLSEMGKIIQFNGKDYRKQKIIVNNT